MGWPKGRARKVPHAAHEEGQIDSPLDGGTIREEERHVGVLREREQGDDQRSPPMTTHITVEGAPEYQGVRVDHPSLLDGIDTLIKKGYGNESIAKIIGCPGSLIDQRRHKLTKLKTEV